MKDVGPIVEAALGVLDPDKCPDKDARIDHIAMLLQDAAFMFREPETVRSQERTSNCAPLIPHSCSAPILFVTVLSPR